MIRDVHPLNVALNDDVVWLLNLVSFNKEKLNLLVLEIV